MALKRRDVVLAAAAIFIAWGYLTHWQPKLHYLPYAFVAGAVATTVFGAWLTFTTAWNKEIRHSRVNYGARHAAFVRPERWAAEVEALTKRNEYMMEPVYPASFVVSDSLDVLVGLILRDFVKSWYGSISKSPTFVNEVDRAIRAALGELRDRILAVDMVETVVSRLIPIITDHLRASYEAEQIVRGRKLMRNVTESEELDLAIAAKYKEGRLHPAASLAYANTKPIQQQHLRSLVARVLPKILPPGMMTSPAVNVLIKELVACAVLSPIMQLVSDPDMWNQLMEGYVSTTPECYEATVAHSSRVAHFSRNARQSASSGPSSTNKRPPRPRFPRTCNSPSLPPATTSGASRSLYEQSDRQTRWPMPAVFAARFPANCARTRRSTARMRCTCGDWRQHAAYSTRRSPT
jgi:sorting nexin-25